ncbi:MAG: BON domain-containing protein [Prolixibacteraceae bacterium]|nr:BON domain-containing protein [Prolixibacteraceae bacterium]
MKRKLAFLSLFFVVAVVFNSCKPSDDKLQKEASAVLAAIPGVSVNVKSGVATLTGEVAAEEVKMAATQALSAVKNLKSVTNNISVKKAPVPVINPDDVLRTAIGVILSAGGDIYKDVKATVENGTVALTGSIARANLQPLIQVIQEAAPGKVDNKLEVK